MLCGTIRSFQVTLMSTLILGYSLAGYICLRVTLQATLLTLAIALCVSVTTRPLGHGA